MTRLKAPSPALVISLIALFVALGGTTYAATSLPANSVGTRQLKNGAVTSKKAAPKLIVYGARAALVAGAAIRAKSADQATNATNLGGKPATSFATKSLSSGQSESGDWIVVTPAPGNLSEAITFPTPLKSPLDGGHVVYMSSGTSPNCPGIGRAAPGYLCVYTTGSSANLSFLNVYTGGGTVGADPYGFLLEFWTNAPSADALGSWTVTAS